MGRNLSLEGAGCTSPHRWMCCWHVLAHSHLGCETREGLGGARLCLHATSLLMPPNYRTKPHGRRPPIC
jgi:hypothetical protein